MGLSSELLECTFVFNLELQVYHRRCTCRSAASLFPCVYLVRISVNSMALEQNTLWREDM